MKASTFEQVDGHLRRTEIAVIAQELADRAKLTASKDLSPSPRTLSPAEICRYWFAVEPILRGALSFPLIPKRWRIIAEGFMLAMSGMCASDDLPPVGS
jgi:hypothetical protein